MIHFGFENGHTACRKRVLKMRHVTDDKRKVTCPQCKIEINKKSFKSKQCAICGKYFISYHATGHAVSHRCSMKCRKKKLPPPLTIGEFSVAPESAQFAQMWGGKGLSPQYTPLDSPFEYEAHRP